MPISALAARGTWIADLPAAFACCIPLETARTPIGNPARLTPEHTAFRDSVRRFVARELEPHVGRWDEAGGFPRGLYRQAAAAGQAGRLAS